MLSHPLWNNWNIKKCCNEIYEWLACIEGDYWIGDGKLMVIFDEGNSELESVNELEECPCCGAKIVCYQLVRMDINEN